MIRVCLVAFVVTLACAPRHRPLSPLEQLLVDERYRDVLARRDRDEVREANLYTDLVARDIAQVMVHGANAPPLLCAPVLERYPTSLDPTMQVCRMLTGHLAGERIDDEAFARLDRYTREHSPRQRFLVEAAKKAGLAPPRARRARGDGW